MKDREIGSRHTEDVADHRCGKRIGKVANEVDPSLRLRAVE